MLQTSEAGNSIGIAGISATTLEMGKSQLRKFQGFARVFGAALKIDGQLFASMKAVLRIGGDLLPDLRGPRVFAAPFGH